MNLVSSRISAMFSVLNGVLRDVHCPVTNFTRDIPLAERPSSFIPADCSVCFRIVIYRSVPTKGRRFRKCSLTDMPKKQTITFMTQI